MTKTTLKKCRFMWRTLCYCYKNCRNWLHLTKWIGPKRNLPFYRINRFFQKMHFLSHLLQAKISGKKEKSCKKARKKRCSYSWHHKNKSNVLLITYASYMRRERYFYCVLLMTNENLLKYPHLIPFESKFVNPGIFKV